MRANVQNQLRLHRVLLEGQEVGRLQRVIAHKRQRFQLDRVDSVDDDYSFSILSLDYLDGAVIESIGEELRWVNEWLQSGLKVMVLMGLP